MFNAMGIMQHHDAITGTAKQAVADTYAQILSSAVESNNELLSQIIGEQATQAGFDSSLNWSACTFTSTTPVDCQMIDLGTWMVAAYNPSTVNQKLLRFSVPSTSSFEVSTIGPDQTWVPAKSDMLCYTDTKDDTAAETFAECELMIEAEVAG